MHQPHRHARRFRDRFSDRSLRAILSVGAALLTAGLMIVALTLIRSL